MEWLYVLNESLSPEVGSAFVSGVFTLLAAVVPSFVIYCLSKRYLSTKQADRTCLNALEEVEYCKALMGVLKDNPEMSYHAARKQVNDLGMRSNGLFSPAKLQAKLKTYRRKVDESLPLL